MRMTDGDPVCDLCNAMWPLGYTELWPAEIRGPYGPDRVTIDSFGICLDCLRRAFGPTRQAAVAHELIWARRNRWVRQAAHEQGLAMAVAEAVVPDAELGRPA